MSPFNVIAGVFISHKDEILQKQYLHGPTAFLEIRSFICKITSELMSTERRARITITQFKAVDLHQTQSVRAFRLATLEMIFKPEIKIQSISNRF